jgi:hypothetical protein
MPSIARLDGASVSTREGSSFAGEGSWLAGEDCFFLVRDDFLVRDGFSISEGWEKSAAVFDMTKPAS